MDTESTQIGASHDVAQYAAFIGLDWGSEKHAVCMSVAGCADIAEYELKQKPEELHDWLSNLQEKFAGRPVAVAIEQSKGAVISALLSYNFIHVFPVNPLSLASYRKAFKPSRAKDDPTDAQLLLELVQVHRDKLKKLAPDTPEVRVLQTMTEFRRKTVENRVALTNALNDLLKQYFPQALDWAGDLDRPMACAFLRKWPTLQAIQKASPTVISKFYKKHGCRRPAVIEQRLDQIRSARTLTTDPAIMHTSVMMVDVLIKQLEPVLAVISDLEKQIKTCFESHPDHDLFSSLPGAGPALAPRLLCAIGSNRDRFHNAGELQQLSGVAPVTERSGKLTWVHRRFACPQFMKQTFHEFAGQSIRFSEWARAYYDALRQRGKGHHAAIRALAYKWIRIIFRCWKDRVVYDEQLYVQRLRNKNVPYLETA